jgi:transposase
MSQSTLAKKLARVKPGTLFVGVDLALDRNVAVVLDERAKRLDRFRFDNDMEGYNYFHRRLCQVKERNQAPAILVGMEPTNYFWKLLATGLEARRVAYRLVNPYTVKKHREGDQLDLSKDDPRDAFVIADLLRTGKYTETQLLHGKYAELRQYAILRARLLRDLRRQKTLVKNIARQLFPELCREFKDLLGQTALALLSTHAAAAAIRQLSLDVFISDVRSVFQGKRLMVSKLRRTYALAHNSVGLKEGVQALQLALDQHIELLAHVQRLLAQAEEALIEVFLALPEAKYILSVPGLGLITAATILAEIGDPNHYSQAKQLIKLAGTQPVPNASGRKSSSRTPMSHKGRSRLRTALFFAAMRLVQVDEAFAQRYLHLQTRNKNPLCKLQALGVLMNKLVRVLWSLMRNHTFYVSGFQPAV